jgi:hypothetical protein
MIKFNIMVDLLLIKYIIIIIKGIGVFLNIKLENIGVAINKFYRIVLMVLECNNFMKIKACKINHKKIFLEKTP